MKKINIKLLFLKKDYFTICSNIHSGIIQIDDLTKQEKNLVKDYALKTKDNSILILFIADEDQNERELLFKAMLINGLTICQLYEVLNKYLEEFVLILISFNINKKDKMLSIAAKVASNSNNTTICMIIANYFKSSHENCDIVRVHYIIDMLNIPIWKELYEDYVLNYLLGCNYEYIKYYFKVVKEPKYQVVLDYVFVTYFNLGNIENFFKDYQNDFEVLNNAYMYIEKNIGNSYIKADYLLKLLETNNCFNHDKIVEELFAINKREVIAKLMHIESEESQNEYCKKALSDNNTKLIKTLAVTTDCITTYKLIDNLIITNDFFTNIYLVENLIGRFLEYVLNKILQTNNITYLLQIINQLYIKSSVKLIEVLNFIIKYQYLELLPKYEQDQILEMTEKEDNLKLVKK